MGMSALIDKTNFVQPTGALLVNLASACSCGVRMAPTSGGGQLTHALAGQAVVYVVLVSLFHELVNHHNFCFTGVGDGRAVSMAELLVVRCSSRPLHALLAAGAMSVWCLPVILHSGLHVSCAEVVHFMTVLLASSGCRVGVLDAKIHTPLLAA